MNIFPLYTNEAKKTHWIVSILRLYGIIQTIGAAVATFVAGREIVAQFLIHEFDMTYEIAGAVAIFITVFGGAIVGLFASLFVFAIAMILEDIHAIRIYVSGYVATNDKADIPEKYFGSI